MRLRQALRCLWRSAFLSSVVLFSATLGSRVHGQQNGWSPQPFRPQNAIPQLPANSNTTGSAYHNPLRPSSSPRSTSHSNISPGNNLPRNVSPPRHATGSISPQVAAIPSSGGLRQFRDSQPANSTPITQSNSVVRWRKSTLGSRQQPNDVAVQGNLTQHAANVAGSANQSAHVAHYQPPAQSGSRFAGVFDQQGNANAQEWQTPRASVQSANVQPHSFTNESVAFADSRHAMMGGQIQAAQYQQLPPSGRNTYYQDPAASAPGMQPPPASAMGPGQTVPNPGLNAPGSQFNSGGNAPLSADQVPDLFTPPQNSPMNPPGLQNQPGLGVPPATTNGAPSNDSGSFDLSPPTDMAPSNRPQSGGNEGFDLFSQPSDQAMQDSTTPNSASDEELPEPPPNPFDNAGVEDRLNALLDAERNSDRDDATNDADRQAEEERKRRRTLPDCDRVRDRALASDITNVQLDFSPGFRVGPKDRDNIPAKKREFVDNAPMRPWYDLQGQFMVDARLVDLTREQVVLETGSGATQRIFLGDLSDADQVYVSESWGFPVTCNLGEMQNPSRAFIASNVRWQASAACHKPLYFEEMQLERYGHEIGPLAQPVVSTAHFFANIAVLPYKAGIHPPHECQYALGYYRPGSCAPWTIGPIPISLRGALSQATGVGLLAIP